MNSENIKLSNKNIISELSISRSERESEIERTEREKNMFAESLKRTVGKEMIAMLSEKKEEETKPKKKNKIKEFFERLIRTCQ